MGGTRDGVADACTRISLVEFQSGGCTLRDKAKKYRAVQR